MGWCGVLVFCAQTWNVPQSRQHSLSDLSIQDSVLQGHRREKFSAASTGETGKVGTLSFPTSWSYDLSTILEVLEDPIEFIYVETHIYLL